MFGSYNFMKERIATSPYLAGSDSSLRSLSEQMCPPVIDAINLK